MKKASSQRTQNFEAKKPNATARVHPQRQDGRPQMARPLCATPQASSPQASRNPEIPFTISVVYVCRSLPLNGQIDAAVAAYCCMYRDVLGGQCLLARGAVLENRTLNNLIYIILLIKQYMLDVNI